MSRHVLAGIVVGVLLSGGGLWSRSSTGTAQEIGVQAFQRFVNEHVQERFDTKEAFTVPAGNALTIEHVSAWITPVSTPGSKCVIATPSKLAIITVVGGVQAAHFFRASVALGGGSFPRYVVQEEARLHADPGSAVSVFYLTNDPFSPGCVFNVSLDWAISGVLTAEP